MQSKAELRSLLTQIRKNRTTSLVESQNIADLAISLIGSDDTDIAIYRSTKIEPPTDFLIAKLQKERNVYLPKVIEQNLVWVKNPTKFSIGAFNISEQVGDEKSFSELQNISALIIPALAADRSGVRLGKGGGYYDRVLSELNPNVKKIALLFDNEIFDEIPQEPHDQKVNYLVTEQKIIKIF